MNFDFVKTIPIDRVLEAGLAAIVFAVGWLKKHQDKIKAIALRIEKENEGGWTAEEKEKLAVDMFFQEVYPTLPWWKAIVPNSIFEGQVKHDCRQTVPMPK